MGGDRRVEPGPDRLDGTATSTQPASSPGKQTRAEALGSPAAMTPDSPAPGIDAPGFIDNSQGAKLHTGPSEAGGRDVLAAPLPPATRVFVSGTHRTAPSWWYVTAFIPGAMVQGYVQGLRVNIDLPEPLAELRQLDGGETPESLAREKFGKAVTDGHDLRFYENVLLHVNQQRNRAGITGSYQDPGVLGGGANNIKLIAGHRIWLVSAEYAKALEGAIPSGSLTGGAVAKVKRFAGHVRDILRSVAEARNHLGEVRDEYAQAIRDHMGAVVGTVGGFLMAEALSALLAAVPTGVTQLAAVVIQLGLALFGARGLVEASMEALQHGSAWLNLAWTAKGDDQQIATASKEFLRMFVAIAAAALAYLGVKGNVRNAFQIAGAMPTGGLGALATAGSPAIGAGARTSVLIGPGTGSLGTAGAMMVKADGEGGSSKSSEPTAKPEVAPAGEKPPVPVSKPASRHTLKKVTQSSVAKDSNTVIEPGVDVAADVEAINAGRATPGMSGTGVRTYTVNGRTYGMEPSGTLFPMTGTGFIMLSRNAYKVLGIFNRLGHTPRAMEIIELQRPTAKFTDAEIERALEAWKAGQGGGA